MRKVELDSVYRFILGYYQSNGETPMNREICARFNLSSPASAHQIIRRLEREGKLTHVPYVTRGIRLV